MWRKGEDGAVEDRRPRFRSRSRYRFRLASLLQAVRGANHDRILKIIGGRDISNGYIISCRLEAVQNLQNIFSYVGVSVDCAFSSLRVEE